MLGYYVRENEIWVGDYEPDGGTDGEMTIGWSDGDPKLTVFDDAWSLLGHPMFAQLFAELGKTPRPATIGQVVDVLKACGFQDMDSLPERDWKTYQSIPYRNVVRAYRDGRHFVLDDGSRWEPRHFWGHFELAEGE